MLYLITDLKIKATQIIDIYGHDTQKVHKSKGNWQGEV